LHDARAPLVVGLPEQLLEPEDRGIPLRADVEIANGERDVVDSQQLGHARQHAAS
jgi:hypothetical protein